jgi:hypothetical protein
VRDNFNWRRVRDRFAGGKKLRDKFTVGRGRDNFTIGKKVRDKFEGERSSQISSQLEEGEVSSQLKSRYCSIELFLKMCLKNV